MKNKAQLSYDGEALDALLYKFPFSDKLEVEDKIRKRLKRKKLGDFDPDRINLLRRFKDQIQMEISQQERSGYYQGPADKDVRLQKHVELDDFDVPRLKADMIAAYPGISSKEIEWFVPFAVSIYHML